MRVNVSVVIPTYNRAALWHRGLLARSLERQTVAPHEILICDDGSSDETVRLLTDRYQRCPQVRLFQVTAPKTGPCGGSVLADNVLFAEASGEVVLHLDDDGFIDDRAVEILQSRDWPAAYFGPNMFCDPETLEVMEPDPRLKLMPVSDSPAIALSRGLCCGAMYAAPQSIIRRIGGHAMEHRGYLGWDSRIGNTLLQHIPCWLLNQPEFRFYHLGLTYYMKLKRRAGDIDYSAWRTTVLGSVDDPPTVNGGQAFWEEGLRGLYVRVF